MKSIIQFFSLLSVLTLFSVSCFATSSTNISEPIKKERNTTHKSPKKVNTDIISVTSEIISVAPCDQGGYQATVRVNIYVNYGEVTLLVASQKVKIPCGTVHNLTRPEFDKNAIKLSQQELPLIVDYLNENDEDGSIFKDISTNIYELMKSLEK